MSDFGTARAAGVTGAYSYVTSQAQSHNSSDTTRYLYPDSNGILQEKHTPDTQRGHRGDSTIYNEIYNPDTSSCNISQRTRNNGVARAIRNDRRPVPNECYEKLQIVQEKQVCEKKQHGGYCTKIKQSLVPVLLGILYVAVAVLAVFVVTGSQKVESRQQHIAFMAELSTNMTDTSVNRTVIFDKIYTSFGRGYDPRTGHFGAPVKGLYSFSLVASSPTKGATDWLHVFIMKNSEQVGYVFLDDNSYHWIQRSVSVVISLDIGDVVFVKIGRQRGDCILAGERFHTVFNGFLIHTM